MNIKIKLKCNQFNFDKKFNNYISLHFRIGDYVLYPNSHPLLKLSYYKNCLNYIINKTNYDKYDILYFCEEKDNNLVLKKIDELKNDFKIYWNNAIICKLVPGKDYLSPDIDLLVDDMLEKNQRIKFYILDC